MQRKIVSVLELSLIVLLVAGTIGFVNRVGIGQIRSNVAQFGIWAPLMILLLRLTSIIVPVLPGTAYAVLAGALFGFGQGLLVIAIADFLAVGYRWRIHSDLKTIRLVVFRQLQLDGCLYYSD